MLNIIVGTKSDIKTNAVREAIYSVFDEYECKITNVDSESKVNNQPYGYEEISEGTDNMIQCCRESVPLNSEEIFLLIAIENGVVKINEEFYDTAYILVENYNTNERYSSFSSAIKIQNKVVYESTSSNFEKTIGDIIDKKSPKDPHSILTNYVVARKDILSQALKIALSQVKLVEVKEENDETDIYAMHPDYGLICTVCGSSAQAQHMDCYNMMNEDF